MFNKPKSLLIIGLPRSGSTAFESACLSSLKRLGFVSEGEFLNRGFKDSTIDFPHNTRKPEHQEKMLKVCKKRRYKKILRDVVQQNFILKNLDWIRETFNTIYLYRPLAEVQCCSESVGWTTNLQERSNLLESIQECPSIKRFDYYDFIFGPEKKLHQLLSIWYPGCVPPKYITAGFIVKRKMTLRKIKIHGIKPQREK